MNIKVTHSLSSSSVWFWSPTLDLTLTLGVLALSLLLGCIGLISDELFYAVLWFDVWFIAHPHLAAMYTRLVLDQESARRARRLLTVAPLVVLAMTAAVGVVLGSLWLITGYYIWQTWHYTRQSYGIMRALEPNIEPSVEPSLGPTLASLAYHQRNSKLASGVIYALPIWGLLHRAHQDPDQFYGWPIYFPQVNAYIVSIAGVISLTLLCAWGVNQLMWVLQGERSASESLARSATQSGLIVSHVLITAVSYLWVEEITQGWLFINIWHNLQYLVFVWAYNARRIARAEPEGDMRDGPDQLRFVRLIALPTRASVTRYFTLCVISGTLFFLCVDALIEATHMLLGYLPDWLEFQVWSASYTQGASLLLVIHLAINFHHYVVDAAIWTRRYMVKHNDMR